jgi:glycosyltransferase involved in cell wall biosynthesis
LDSPELRNKLGENARKRAETLYTLSAFETQLAALYDEVRSRVVSRGSRDVVAQEEA